ncbi:hypothetical protein ROJ8625_02011 [Roseivivax jejudonensis]|uniref:Uncharacterized protein n=1 Tax=Roseivivax jejudonensis TaxID=1529041 RepID=A0A1X6Z666_9RHOB|nr:hypothetical protein [Roseivivax jejudonensis]SLN41782.1 hypothetical protein ROJ8625_02011 [Roseivivax jejudonensis]
MSPVVLLCGIIAQSGKVSATTYRDLDAYGQLVTTGLVRRQGLVQSVLCDACDMGHDAAIVFDDGRYGHVCPEIGFVPVERSELIAVAPDFEALATQIAAALGCKAHGARRLADQTWHIGTVRTATADIAVFFHARLQTTQDLQSLETVLRDQVRTRFGLVLTARGTLPVPGLSSAPLDQVLGFDPAHGGLVAEADLSVLVGAPVTLKGGRPATHADRIKAIIAERSSNGRTATGKNAEIRAIQSEYAAQFPGGPTPSRSAIMYHLPKLPGGRKPV